jgi:hypothetical protein
MSLIALRRLLRRHGRRTAAALVALSLSAVIAAHHAGVHGGHAPVHGAHLADHVPLETAPAPADAAQDLIAVCAAVLPALLLGALIAGRLGLRRLLDVTTTLVSRPVWPPGTRVVDHRARAGPRVLCVMRC